MKKLIFMSIALLLLCSCGNNKVYVPSKFPDQLNRQQYSFAIPYIEKNKSIIVRVRLNGGPEFQGVWDSGCSVPIKISRLEADALFKNKTLSYSDYQSKIALTVANGQTDYCDVYKLKSVSFVDTDGNEHVVNNVNVVIDDNANTEILIGLPIMQDLGDSQQISSYDQAIYFKD